MAVRNVAATSLATSTPGLGSLATFPAVGSSRAIIEPLGGAKPRFVFRPIADVTSLRDVAVVRRDKDSWSPSTWASRNGHAETLLDDLQLLLGDLCRESGLCNALADDIRPESGIVSSDHFANAVLRAEGWPEDDLPLQWQETMRKVFEARYGSSIWASAYEQRLRG